jgi:hypothetical protein
VTWTGLPAGAWHACWTGELRGLASAGTDAVANPPIVTANATNPETSRICLVVTPSG